MHNEICKICNVIITGNTKGGAKHKLGTHLKYAHALTPVEYVLRFEYNNIWPVCQCGCGTKLKYYKWAFGKYYLNHKDNCSIPIEVREKISNTLSKISPEKRIELHGLTKDQLIDAWNKYKTPEFPGEKISEILALDNRVIKKYWILLNIAKSKEIQRIGKLHKEVWSNQLEKNGQYIKIDDNVLLNIYTTLQENKNKLTIFDIKYRYNIKYSELVIFKRLCEKFGKDDINRLLKSGLSSKPEMLFYNILAYYFDKKNIKKQFLLERKIYDFLLFDKLIIEFDGEYWHKNSQENDRLKDQIALKHGYIIFRVKEKDSHNLDILIKIRDIVNEIQTNTNIIS